MPLDNSSPDHFKQQLDIDTKNGNVFKDDGWSIHVRRYDIPVPGSSVHTSIELHGPARDDDSKFYSSVDTYTFSGPETPFLATVAHMAFPYVTGTEMRMTTDNDRDGNWVVKDKHLVQDNVVFSGSGAEAVLRFAQITEQAAEFNTSKTDYALYSEDKDGVERANSNAGPLQLLDNLGYDVSEFRNEKFGDYSAPGAADEISSQFPIKEKLYFEALPMRAAGALLDPNSTAHNKLVDMMKQMNPDVIEQRGVDNPFTPAVSGAGMNILGGG